MPTINITVCANCGKVSCDGGMWKITKVTRIQCGTDITYAVHPDNLLDCTLKWFGRNRYDSFKLKDVTGKPVGTVIVKQFRNWSDPSIVELTKVEM